MPTYKYCAAVLLIFLAFDAAYACSCIQPQAPCAYYGETSAIFLGRVVGSAERRTSTAEHGNKVVYDVGTIRFLVQEKPLKLVLSKEGYGYDDDEKPTQDAAAVNFERRMKFSAA